MKNLPLRVGAAVAAAILAASLAVPALADVVGGDGWSRATVPGATDAVGYLVLTNNGDESRSLLAITSPVSDRITLHRSSIDSQGVARMWPVGSLKVAPGESVKFEPNGLHVMFADLKRPFKVGEKVPVLLRFDGFEAPFTVMLEVRPLVPAIAPAEHSQPRH